MASGTGKDSGKNPAGPEGIPEPAVRRLSLYLRELENFRANNRKTVSSRELGDALGLTDAQVRKDFGYFGQFGQPGIGYQVEELVGQLRRILGTDRVWNVAVIGQGNLGRALTAYRGFLRKGFQIVAVFDDDPDKVGQVIPSLESIRVQHIRELKKTAADKWIRLAILAVPAEYAQPVAEQCVAAGIQGILNFAPVSLTAPAEVAVTSVDLAVQLEQLAFRVLGSPPRF
ncbi:MAG: redox-sensing transcriptional repressor Rex [Phycisphaerae bacterium]|nr:redox-sensing transcriptional repressor Rex [Phycisphaerae bacterium]